MSQAHIVAFTCVFALQFAIDAQTHETSTVSPMETAPVEAEPVSPIEASNSVVETPPTSAPVDTAATTPQSPTPTPPVEENPITVTAEPGRGFTIRAGEVFSSTWRARLQLRDTVRIPETGEVTNELNIKTVRIWVQGNVLDRNIRYGLQLALGARDFETSNASPLFDAFIEFTHLRDLSLKVGQYFVPFDRARTIREFGLQTVDRSQMVTELTLDRDVGISIYSNDFLGCDGRLFYQLGVFGGDGRNRFGGTRPGFLYTARVAFRPFGTFDDDIEGDLERRAAPRLSVGAAFAYNQATDRVRSSNGNTLRVANFDYVHAAVDAVFKWHGLSLLAEFVYRGSNAGFRDGMDGTMMIREYARQGYGVLAQAGLMLTENLETWVRYDQLEALSGTDPEFVTQASARGRATSAGINLYLNGHAFKVQFDWQHLFYTQFGRGGHSLRLQLDASF